jgi:hypothetical protein
MSVSLRAAFVLCVLAACETPVPERPSLPSLPPIPPDRFEAVEKEVNHRLPDTPRGALTASVAAFLAKIPGAEVDGTFPPVTIGYLLTDPIEATFPRDPKTARALFDFMKTRDVLWQLDSIRFEEKWIAMRFHGYNFAGSKELDRVRRTQLKRGILADLSDRMEKIEHDAELLLDVFDEAKVIPVEMTIGIRMGRRICSLTFSSEEEKKKVIAVGASKKNVALDAKERELVLPTGRVCSLKFLSAE